MWLLLTPGMGKGSLSLDGYENPGILAPHSVFSDSTGWEVRQECLVIGKLGWKFRFPIQPLLMGVFPMVFSPGGGESFLYKVFCFLRVPYQRQQVLLEFLLSALTGISRWLASSALCLGYMRQKENPKNSLSWYTSYPRFVASPPSLLHL